MLNSFITGLQFLTRIRVVTETSWSPERFGRSVKFFPCIGAILGLHLALFYQVGSHYAPFVGLLIPPHVMAALLIVLSVLLTGGLHCDGFMDTMDGVFSGRSRERMLEIMKDSRVGANGVVAFVLLVMLKWSILLDISPDRIWLALFSMPILGRLGMVIAITCFPYARPDGIGKAFALHAGKMTLMIAVVTTLALLGWLGTAIVLPSLLSLAVSLLICWYINRQLGGLTGDVYGAVSELTELAALLAFLL